MGLTPPETAGPSRAHDSAAKNNSGVVIMTHWTISRGELPILATAIHAGHELRPEVLRLMDVDEGTRLREEDPFTDGWTRIAANRVVVHVSRFELDLNRPREGAVYLEPQDAWGIEVWRMLPQRRTYEASLETYDLFYETMGQLLDELICQHGRIVVLDLHSYCHRRAGPGKAADDQAFNPDINVGTGSLDRGQWGPLVDHFIETMRGFELDGKRLDVRENIKFRGGHFPTWINRTRGESACVLAVEVKKIFMDEWTGKLDYHRHRQIGAALAATVPGLLELIR